MKNFTGGSKGLISKFKEGQRKDSPDKKDDQNSRNDAKEKVNSSDSTKSIRNKGYSVSQKKDY